MKPVIIIAIAVVCSVIAALVVLIGSQQISEYQVRVAYDEYQAKVKAAQEVEYAKNKEMCAKLFGAMMSMTGEITPYQYCLEKDYLSAKETAINDCITTASSRGYDGKASCTQKYSEKLADALKGN